MSLSCGYEAFNISSNSGYLYLVFLACPFKFTTAITITSQQQVIIIKIWTSLILFPYEIDSSL